MTQAVDIVPGGVKVHALPDEAHAIVNHKITWVHERYIELLAQKAAESNRSVVGFGEDWPDDYHAVPIHQRDRHAHLSEPHARDLPRMVISAQEASGAGFLKPQRF
ncbi:hypothetical protein B0H14DRAFT_3065948 [Mycena olivaceomarginata]|nr:hypothetical protein B0H14DRAFT_3065948 [Mycena olivaceomarginata]